MKNKIIKKFIDVELKECPICNNVVKLRKINNHSLDIICRQCGLKLKKKIKDESTIEHIVALWNNRVPCIDFDDGLKNDEKN
jgi:transcription elongation factor Elf1